MTPTPLGVILMAYGTPASQEAIPDYLAHIMGGRTPSPQAVADLARRYQAIGGGSPLHDITMAQAKALEQRLNAIQGNPGYRVYVGMRHAPPFISDTVARVVDEGIEQSIAIALAPHYSRMGSGAYAQAAIDAIEKVGRPLAFRFVQSWHMQPALISALAERAATALELLPASAPQGLLFTAHSLPERAVTNNDPYLEQLHQTCAAVAAKVGQNGYTLAFQSAGRSGEPWLGPSMQDAVVELHKQGIAEVVVCPVGFVSDNLEILYDIDIELRGHAAAMGVHIERTESLNAQPDLIGALADTVREASDNWSV